MRFLLLSDTHGKLGIINELAACVHADAVIHAGDFGFYDDESYERLSDRELRLLIVHSDLSSTDRERILALPKKGRIAAAKRGFPLSEFPLYIAGERRFDVPVFAVWGNHEDRDLVEELFRGDIQVENLRILHHRSVFRIGRSVIYGVGGNLLAGSKFLQSPIAGGGGKIWSTLGQYSDLVETVEGHADRSTTRIFVSHVSPGKEPFVEFVAARTRADVTVSGHMGPPTCMVWNPFAICTVEEATNRLQDGLEKVRMACLGGTATEAKWAEEALALIGRIPEETVHIGRGARAPRWYRGMTHVNLPDSHVGYAILDVEGEDTAIQTALSAARHEGDLWHHH